MTTNYSLLNWENPDPYDAGYWLALRDALTSRRIAMDTILAGPHIPFNKANLAAALIIAIRQSLSLWSDTAAATSWAVFGRSFLPHSGTPIRGFSIASPYWSEMLILLHGAILKLRYRLVPVTIENSWAIYYPYPGYGSGHTTPNESIAEDFAALGSTHSGFRTSWAHFFSTNYIQFYQSLGKVSITNPLHVAGTATVVTTALDTSTGGAPYPETPFDAFGTGFAEGDNAFSLPVGKTVILEDSTPPRLLDNNSFDYPDVDGRGFVMPEYAWIDYGSSLILTDE